MKNENTAARFWRSSFCYLFGNLLSKIAVFLLLPLYTARIPTGDMGEYDMAIAIAVLVSSVLFLDIGIGVLRFFLRERSEKNENEILAASFFLVFCFSLLYVLVAVLFGLIFDIAYFPLIALYGILHALFTFFGSVARARGFAAFYAVSGAVSTLVQVSVNLTLILGLDFGVSSLYLAYAAGTLVGILMLGTRCRVLSILRHTRPSRETVKALLRFCLPLGLSTACFWLLTSANRILVTVCLGAEANGVFAVSVRFAQILVFFSTCFQFAWQELAFLRGHDRGEEGARYYTEKLNLFFAVFSAGLLLVIPATRVGLAVFPWFIDASYGEALSLLPLALFGAFFAIFSAFLEPVFNTVGKNGTMMLSTLVGAAINVGLSLLLFSLGVGVVGASVAYLVAYAAVVLIRLLCLGRLVGARLKIRTVLLLLPALSAVLCYYLFPPLVSFLLLLASVLLVGTVFLLLLKRARQVR